MHVCWPYCQAWSHACVPLTVQTRHKQSRGTTTMQLTLVTCPPHALTMPSLCVHSALTTPSPCPHNALTTLSLRPHSALTVPSQRIHNALTMPSPCPHNGPPLVPSPCPQCALTMGPPQCPHSGPTMLQISTCNDLTSSSCEVTADGVGAVQGFTQLSDTSYQIDVQVRDPALCL